MKRLGSFHTLLSRQNLWFVLIVIIVSLTIPGWQLSNYLMNLLFLSMIYTIGVVGYDFIFGHLGQVSFAQVAFFGIGAYTVAIVTTQGGTTSYAYILGIVISIAVAVVLGFIIFRLSGHYLAIATLGLTEIFQIAVNSLGITKGVYGITNIPSPSFFSVPMSSNTMLYYFLWCMTFISLLVASLILRSRFGRIFHAVRESEVACASLGLNIRATKVLGLTLSAVWGAFAGGLFAQVSGYISPDSFGMGQIVVFLAMLIIGGRSSLLGATIGACLITFLPEWLRFLQDWYVIVYAVALVILITLAPRGLAGLIQELQTLLHKHLRRTPMDVGRQPNERW